MVAQLVSDLERAVSVPRLTKYRPPSGSDLDLVVNYFWNIELSQASYSSLAALEVTLRSNIHRALTAREGTDLWFRRLLEPGQLRDFAHAYLSLFQRHKGAQPTSDQIVAELTFGFWTTLLSHPYHQALWAPNKAALVKDVFPHLPPTPNNRHFIHQRYNDLRFFRNRVMHHEPILGGVRLPQNRTLGLVDLHAQVIEAIGWISPTARRAVEQIDVFDWVHQNGRAEIENRLRAEFGFP